MQSVASRRNIPNRDLTVMIADRVKRRIQDNNYCAHLRMNVAEDIADAWAIKANQACAPGLVEPEVETLAFEQREHVVEERVLVGKLYDGSYSDDQDVWIKALVLLRQPQMLLRCRRFQ